MHWPDKKSQYQEIHEVLFDEKEVYVLMLRDDLLHPGISGNKWRKLKYIMLDAFSSKLDTIVTVGGSHSNHIAAVAAAGKAFGFKTVGLIRGYEAYRNNPTLSHAEGLGMEIRFFDKSEYAHIEEKHLPLLKKEIGEFYFVPLGGGNELGTKGSMEVVNDISSETTHIAVACGTGSTLAGIALAASESQNVMGFPVMKNGMFIRDEVRAFQKGFTDSEIDFQLFTDFHFGGFGKMTPELISFIQVFYQSHLIPLDGIYNGKMMWGLYQLIKADYFPKGSVITAIHTGGLQGNSGLEGKYKIKLPH